MHRRSVRLRHWWWKSPLAARVVPALGVMVMALGGVVSILPSSQTRPLPEPVRTPPMALPAPTQTLVTTVMVAPPSPPPPPPPAPVTVTKQVPVRTTEHKPPPKPVVRALSAEVFDVIHDPAVAPATVRTTAELDQLLTDVAARAERDGSPLYAEITSPYVPYNLAVGLGQDGYSVLGWYDDYYSEVLTSDGTIPTPEDAGFCHRGTWMDAPPDSAVPIADARQAALEFVTTGRRPSGVQWRPVMY